jgi:predicted RNA methylase
LKTKLGNRRVTGKEQFYTPSALALELAKVLEKYVGAFANHTVIEPAGGTGAFIKAVQNLGASKIVAFDIEPKHPLVKRSNFLATPLKNSQAITVSNPPFGRNNSLSIPFFNHAAEASDFIAFVVPRSWRKWSVINRLDRRFHLVHDQDLQIDYVDESDEPLHEKNHLKTCFQIWQKLDQQRPIYRVRDEGLVTKVDPAEADVSLTQFGYGCGNVATDFERVPNTTKLFLKVNHPDVLAAITSVDFSKFYVNTAYTEALSLQEVNYLLNEAIFGNPHLEEIS